MNSPNETLLPNQQEQWCMVRMALAKWQPNGKTHFPEKSGKNMVNTSNNGPSSNMFKITSYCAINQISNLKLTTFSQINVSNFQRI